MRVLVLAPYPPGRAPSQRYRIEQWLPALEREGFSFVLAPFASPRLQDILYAPGRSAEKALRTLSGWLRRLPLALAPGDFDLIFLHREATLLGPAWIEQRLARSGIPIVYDFDDAIFLPFTSPTNPLADRLRFPGKTATICRLAAAVVAGNAWLADWARTHNPRVTVVPSTIDTDLYRPPDPRTPPGPDPPSRTDTPLRLGWTGSHSSLRYLDALRAPLLELARRMPFRLRVIGAAFSCPGVEIECLPWSEASEVADLAPIDIGLMPLADEEWVKGKCSFKALQYMALGIPPVLSPVGMNLEVVKDGASGLFASSDSDWVQALERLARDPGLRKRLGSAARRTVEERYSLKSQAPRVAALLREAAAARRR